MIFQKEEINEKVVVPESVEIELKRLIEEKLNQAGVFFRVYSRTKTPESLEKKFAAKQYDQDKKIQDLIGVRINLYFQDDIKVVKSLMEKLFTIVEWAENKIDVSKFEPMKVNGVFKLPTYLVAKVGESTWSLPIDQTFEIQLKTAFFEGWHEVEHDMRYKNKELWERHESYSRRFNSIVATLELCDRSIIDIFDDMAHSLYKECDWAGMIRMHFRIRISEQDIYEEFIPILEEDDYRIGKEIFRFKRAELIGYLSSFYRDIAISVNMIIALINDRFIQDPRIKEIARNRRVYHDGISTFGNEKKRRELRRMCEYKIFNNSVTIDYSETNRQEIFQRTTNCIFKWMTNKFGRIFSEIPTEKKTFSFNDSGYFISITCEDEYFSMRTAHIDHEVAGRVWNTSAELFYEEEELRFNSSNYISDVNDITEQEQINNFSAPGFYLDISRDYDLPVRDVMRLKDSTKIIKGEKNPEKDFYELVTSEKRFNPVVLVVYDTDENGNFDRSWLSSYWSSILIRWVKYYAHVYESTSFEAGPLADMIDSPVMKKGVYLFFPKSGEVRYYSEEDIVNWQLRPGDIGIVRSNKTEGSEAFMNDLVRLIKRINITN